MTADGSRAKGTLTLRVDATTETVTAELSLNGETYASTRDLAATGHASTRPESVTATVEVPADERGNALTPRPTAFDDGTKYGVVFPLSDSKLVRFDLDALGLERASR